MSDCADAGISLLEYLTEHGWKPSRDSGRDEIAGLCPLHQESRPSFYVNRRKQVFYCHGCGRGGGLTHLRTWLEGVPFSQHKPTPAELLEETYAFYQQHLPRSPEARVYLRQRGIYDPRVIERMRIGYAPGACLRAHLVNRGYRSAAMMTVGLIDARARDRFFRCLTFPLKETSSLYGRSIDRGIWRHRFLPRTKGGLYGWGDVQASASVIVVEGLFDVAALWQAGFPQAVAALGSRLNSAQLAQLSSSASRKVYVSFDADLNGSGQGATRQLCAQLRQAGVIAFQVSLPEGHDPASLFAAGASARDYQRLLEGARP